MGILLRQEMERLEREKIRQEWVEKQEKIKSENWKRYFFLFCFVLFCFLQSNVWQIYSMLLCLCSVKDNKICKNVVRTKKGTHKSLMLLPYIFVFCDLHFVLLYRPKATWNLFVLYGKAKSSMCLSSNEWLVRTNQNSFII